MRYRLVDTGPLRALHGHTSNGGIPMKAMLSHTPGGPRTLVWDTLPDPEPKAGEVVIRVHAAAVNFPDTLIIQDLYQFKPPRPFAPGGEVAGEVAAVGTGVDGVKVGERVLAFTVHGGFATHVVVPAHAAIPIPDAMPYDHAACLLLTYGTAYHGLKDRAALKPGEDLLILGAAGGVGSAAIELGKAAGARVIAAVSSQEKAAFCADLGADETLIYGRDLDRDAQKALSKEMKSLATGEGVDVVFDTVGGDYAEPALRAMAWTGRFLVVGFPAGIPKIPLNLPLLKGTQIVGVFWGSAVLRDPKAHAQNVSELFQLYLDGKICPQIERSYDIQNAADALERITARTAKGKLVLTVADDA